MPGTVQRDTAIVLCDSALLQPVLRSVPSNRVEHLNVTMGYPLRNTSVYALIQILLDFQQSLAIESGRHTITQVREILSNPLVAQLVPESDNLLSTLIKNKRLYPSPNELYINSTLQLLFDIQTDNLSLLKYLINVLELLAPLFSDTASSGSDTLNQESVYLAYTKISRFYYLVEIGRAHV